MLLHDWLLTDMKDNTVLNAVVAKRGSKTIGSHMHVFSSKCLAVIFKVVYNCNTLETLLIFSSRL